MRFLRSIHLSHLVLVVFGGALLSTLIVWGGTQLVSDQFYRKMSDFVILHMRFLQLEGGEGVANQAEKFEDMRKDLRVYIFDTWILDEKGKVLYQNSNHPPPPVWEKAQLNGPLNELQHLERNIRKNIVLVRLSEKPSRYALYEHLTGKRFLFYALGAQVLLLGIIVLLTAVLSSFFIVFYSRRKSQQALHVIESLEAGNLKARFHINKLDEVGSLMERFNTMAQKIESLVQQLRQTDQGRKKLLQEMSHDLRSPITSLRTSLELMASGKLSKSQQRDLIAVADQEIAVLSDFVEDLFFLSVADDPQYRSSGDCIDIGKFIQEQVQRRKIGTTEDVPSLKWHFQRNGNEDVMIHADPRLLRRLFANIFDNISRFAKENVWVSLSQNGEVWNLSITDDGPGFTVSQLENFGNRPPLINDELGRAMDTSFGLGSVIVRTIASVHGWEMHVSNRDSRLGTGAQFCFHIPRLVQGQAA